MPQNYPSISPTSKRGFRRPCGRPGDAPTRTVRRDSVAIGTSIYDTSTITGRGHADPTVTYHMAGSVLRRLRGDRLRRWHRDRHGAASDVQTLDRCRSLRVLGGAAANANNEAATSTCGSETVIVRRTPLDLTHLTTPGPTASWAARPRRHRHARHDSVAIGT